MRKNSVLKKLIKTRNFIFFFFFFFLFSFFIIYWAVYFPTETNSAEETVFLVKEGEGIKEISFNLQKQGLIKSKSLFIMYLLLRGEEKNLKAGKYTFSKAMTMAEIANKFILGDAVKNKITIIEGWNLNDIGRYFENKEMFRAEELFEKIGFPAQALKKENWKNKLFFNRLKKEFSFLADKPENVNLEGYLFPDSYEISSEAGLEEIIKIFLANFDKKLTLDLRKEIKKQRKSIFEVITMASMLEKEVRGLEDKKIVSGILWKRLKLGIPLQVDATVNYVSGKKSLKILKKEIRVDSPYNTYKYKGLPMGPIANPGLESIKAAVYPKESPYLYYLSAPEGETIFSRTLREHNIAKAKYLK